LKEQLKLLIEVQKHDAKIQELDGMLKAYPAKLDAMRADLVKVEQMLGKERQQLDDTEGWRKRQLDEMTQEEDALLKAKQRSAQVKNVKEMMASERELQANRKHREEKAEEVEKLSAAVETAKKTIAAHETDVETLRKHVDEEQAAATVKMAEIEAQIVEARKEREVAAARVRPDVMKKYSTIRMRRGLALAAVHNGTCQGCSMNIPPQIYNILQRGDTLELCGSCNRIIFWDKLLEETDGKPSGA
jgi:predicted  nucleic acid-binding Zn-ribbon protein